MQIYFTLFSTTRVIQNGSTLCHCMGGVVVEWPHHHHRDSIAGIGKPVCDRRTRWLSLDDFIKKNNSALGSKPSKQIFQDPTKNCPKYRTHDTLSKVRRQGEQLNHYATGAVKIFLVPFCYVVSKLVKISESIALGYIPYQVDYTEEKLFFEIINAMRL